MHFADSIFIFLLALVLFGPKRLPEIGKQIGKLLAEFRRASNEFKMQIDEELRNIEREEQRKKLEAPVVSSDATALPAATASEESSQPVTPTILPPSTGETVSTSSPFAATPEPPAVIDAGPVVHIEEAHTVTAAASLHQESGNGASHSSEQEPENTSLHHG
jgi:TatA/E family protein of Tat protein translocase